MWFYFTSHLDFRAGEWDVTCFHRRDYKSVMKNEGMLMLTAQWNLCSMFIYLMLWYICTGFPEKPENGIYENKNVTIIDEFFVR